MNNYKLADLKLGLKEEFKVTITKEMQSLFRQMSGDVNPMHIDKEFAVRAGFDDCLVYGMCTAGFYSTLVGVYLPGTRCLFHECDVSWPLPVYIGDELTVGGVVTQIDERFGQIIIKAEIRNQDGKKVSRAKLRVGVRDIDG